MSKKSQERQNQGILKQVEDERVGKNRNKKEDTEKGSEHDNER